nr:tripartite tricarboxylate transporter permease [Nocardioides litoris]
MDLLSNLSLGLETALQWENVLFCLVGGALGTAVGVLPGIGPTATIAMLLPVTFSFDSPTTALNMLAGIYYGAQYGGSTTAILINLPGESSSAVTAIDGHEMARRGRAGVALATAALGSFVAGTVGTLVLPAAAPPLAQVALSFGSAEYFALVVLGLVMSIALARGSVLKALAMIALGILLGTVGQDPTPASPASPSASRSCSPGSASSRSPSVSSASPRSCATFATRRAAAASCPA